LGRGIARKAQKMTKEVIALGASYECVCLEGKEERGRNIDDLPNRHYIDYEGSRKINCVSGSPDRQSGGKKRGGEKARIYCNSIALQQNSSTSKHAWAEHKGEGKRELFLIVLHEQQHPYHK